MNNTWLLLGHADLGDCGQPGDGQSEESVKLYLTPQETWVAIGECKYGSNQGIGYFQVNREYGPWQGKGPTAIVAIDSMLSSTDEEYYDVMRRAGSAAIAELPERCDYYSAATATIGRLKKLRRDYPEHWDNKNWKARQRALRRAIKTLDAPLADASDEEIFAAAKARGFAVRRKAM